MSIRCIILVGVLMCLGAKPVTGQALDIFLADTVGGNGLGRNTGIIVPAFFYQEETSFGGGVGGGYYFTRHRVNKVSNIQGMAIYTAKHQYKVSVLPKIYVRDHEVYYSGHLRWSHYPDKFFGVGRNTHDTLEENFTSRGFSMLIQRQRVLFDVLMVGVQVAADYSTMVEFAPQGWLEGSGLSGTQTYFTSGLGVVATWDNRDYNFYATQGEFYRVSILVHSRAFGSDIDYTRITTDLRKFYPIASDQAIGVQMYGDFTWGPTPFLVLPAVGGNEILRGYYHGRYRDRMMLSAQTEYRFPLYRRLRGCLFVSAADVAPQLNEFSLMDTRVTFGTGLRFRVNPAKVHLRFDLGVTQELKPAVYFTASEAF